jgi:translation initiation factor 2B subunit (eIF-2B alpha/beta/delta family)
MKSREHLLRLKHFQVQDKTRQLAQIDMMIADFERMSGELEAQVEAEEKKAGITDVNHFAYPTFAKAALQRIENLSVSIKDLRDKRAPAEEALKEAEEELRKAELKESRDAANADSSDSLVDSMVERRVIIG